MAHSSFKTGQHHCQGLKQGKDAKVSLRAPNLLKTSINTNICWLEVQQGARVIAARQGQRPAQLRQHARARCKAGHARIHGLGELDPCAAGLALRFICVWEMPGAQGPGGASP